MYLGKARPQAVPLEAKKVTGFSPCGTPSCSFICEVDSEMSSNALTPQSARAFADRWISAWNRKDVEAVLADFSDDVMFTSPRAKSVVGSPRVVGKSQLREYWTRSLSRIQSLRFTLDHVLCDGDRLAILYIAEIDGKCIRAVEFLNFGPDGLIREGEAMHGVELEPA